MVLVLLWAACTVAGSVIGRGKGRGLLGGVLGACLGVIGLVVIVWLSPAPGYGAHDRSTHTRVGRPPPPRPTGAAWSPRGEWAPDPYRRHQMRWWSGGAWTDRVSDQGVLFRDPHGAEPTPEAPPVPGWPGQ
jgi:hypothetical protein